jgi:hypothetical protein
LNVYQECDSVYHISTDTVVEFVRIDDKWFSFGISDAPCHV